MLTFFSLIYKNRNTRSQELQADAQLKLARNPYKQLGEQYTPLYQKFAKFYAKSVAKNAQKDMNGNANDKHASDEAAINSDDMSEQNDKQAKTVTDEETANGTGDEEMKQDDVENPTKKLKVQTNGIESDETDSNTKLAETGSSVVLLD